MTVADSMTQEETTLRITRDFKASPEKVFDAVNAGSNFPSLRFGDQPFLGLVLLFRWSSATFGWWWRSY
ncbi:hypothetical protein PsAD37_02947 [Pseudovibrio sp. Ad37]|nr:hypothetical protein PsAD37_02947 [Pseudovibrio sp. Ad37]